MHRLRPTLLVAAVWAWLEARRVRRLLQDGLPEPGVVRRPPRLPDAARRAVVAVLHRTRATCLVEALVLQAWDAAHGQRRDVVIGVTGAKDFHAHAWLDGDPGTSGEGFAELVRVSAPTDPIDR